MIIFLQYYGKKKNKSKYYEAIFARYNFIKSDADCYDHKFLCQF